MQKATAKTDPLYIATQVRRMVHGDKRLSLTTVSKWLGLTPSGLSHAMSRPDSMRFHARRLAMNFKCSLSDLTGLPEDDAEQWLPPVDQHPQAKKRVRPVNADNDAVERLKLVSPNFGLKERFNLDPDCEAVRIPVAEGVPDGTYMLLGPARMAARINDRVFVETKDGRKLVKLYNVDEGNKQIIVLMPEIAGAAPVVVRQSQIKEVRLIIGELIVR